LWLSNQYSADMAWLILYTCRKFCAYQFLPSFSHDLPLGWNAVHTEPVKPHWQNSGSVQHKNHTSTCPKCSQVRTAWTFWEPANIPHERWALNTGQAHSTNERTKEHSGRTFIQGHWMHSKGTMALA
jgi:hypothetical protein